MRNFFQDLNYSMSNTLNDIYKDLMNSIDPDELKVTIDYIRNLMSSPKFEVDDKGDAMNIEFEIPGVKKETVDVTVTKDILNMKWNDREGKDVAHNIRIKNLDKYNINSVTAKVENGILTISVPKKKQAVEEEKEKKIKVE